MSWSIFRSCRRARDRPAKLRGKRVTGLYLPREVFFGRLLFAGAFVPVCASDFGRFFPATSGSFRLICSPETLAIRLPNSKTSCSRAVGGSPSSTSGPLVSTLFSRAARSGEARRDGLRGCEERSAGQHRARRTRRAVHGSNDRRTIGEASFPSFERTNHHGRFCCRNPLRRRASWTEPSQTCQRSEASASSVSRDCARFIPTTFPLRV
jgi:hypothetical protein